MYVHTYKPINRIYKALYITDIVGSAGVASNAPVSNIKVKNIGSVGLSQWIVVKQE